MSTIEIRKENSLQDSCCKLMKDSLQNGALGVKTTVEMVDTNLGLLSLSAEDAMNRKRE